MKRIFLIILVLFLFEGKTIAQTWTGTPPGDIYYNQGNIGVSASSPKAKLHLAGISTNTVGGDGFLLSDDSSPTRAFLLRLDNSSHDFHIDSRYNNTWANVMTIKRNGGNVGIGLSPQGRFQVRGGTSTTSYLNGVAVYNNSGSAIRSSLAVTSDDDGRINLYNSSTSLKVLINSVGDSYFNGGNIGIQASSPKARLHVSGISTDVVGGDGILLSDDTTPTRAFMLRLDNTNEDLQIDRKYNNSWSNSMTIQRSTGRVGIYASIPKARLHVSGISTDVVGGDGILLSDDTNPTRAFMLRLDNTNEDLQIDRKYNNSWSNSMTIQRSTGFVGIGTDAPLSKLAVDGQIRATEVKVLAVISVPDYVFEPDYELRTLKETKQFITENKHLPEIPSASEIGENGIDLGDMNMRLLKKIEELTLHLIEQSERVEKLEKEVSILKNK